MHPAAMNFVAAHATDAEIKVVEIGSRNINGSVRNLFPNADYWGIDVVDGPDVDEVADGATWQPPAPVDLVICCEVFEHTPTWPLICESMFTMLKPGGKIVLTMAGPGRPVHGVSKDYGPGGYYQNVEPDVLVSVLTICGFDDIEVDQLKDDVRATARKR